MRERALFGTMLFSRRFFFIITTIINLIRCCLIERILFLSFSRLSRMFMFVFIIMGNWWCGHWGWLFDCLVMVQDAQKANFMTFERNEKTLKATSLKKFHSISQKDVKRILVTHLTWWKHRRRHRYRYAIVFRGNDFGSSLPVKKREIKNEFYGNCDDDVLNWMRNGARDGERKDLHKSHQKHIIYKLQSWAELKS